MASVTPHARLESISSGINVKILSVYEAIGLGLYCQQIGMRNMLVLGTIPYDASITSPSGGVFEKTGRRDYWSALPE